VNLDPGAAAAERELASDLLKRVSLERQFLFLTLVTQVHAKMRADLPSPYFTLANILDVECRRKYPGHADAIYAAKEVGVSIPILSAPD